MGDKQSRNKSNTVRDDRATEHKSTWIISGTHTLALAGSSQTPMAELRAITSGSAGYKYLQRASQETTNKQAVGFRSWILPLMPPETQRGQQWHWRSLVLVPTGVNDTCIFGRQISAAQPCGAGEVSVPTCHQQCPPKTLMGSLPKGFLAERASGMKRA